MAKTKVQKEEMLSKLNEKVEQMKSAVIVDYKGLKVKDTEDLRRALREKGTQLVVTKNTLVKIALTKKGIEFDESIFKKPVAVAFAMEDEVASVKDITLFAKKNEALEILGGIIENKFIDEPTVQRLASLPTKDQLRGQVVGTIAAPLNGMVNVFVGNLRGVVNALNALREKKS